MSVGHVGDHRHRLVLAGADLLDELVLARAARRLELASVSLKRLFSRRILAMVASSCDEQRQRRKCICRASACSICCDQADALVRLRRAARLCSRSAEDRLHAEGAHRDEQQRDDQERAQQLGVHRGADAGHPAHEGAQRGPRQHDSGDLLELDFRLAPLRGFRRMRILRPRARLSRRRIGRENSRRASSSSTTTRPTSRSCRPGSPARATRSSPPPTARRRWPRAR